MHVRPFRILFLLLVHAASSVEAAPGILEYAAFPDRTNNFAEASFACLAPVAEPRAILFLAGGTDSDVRPWLGDPHWIALAKKERLALIAACLRGAGEAYEVASGGSGQALLDAIAAFARQSGRPELERLPLILYGHSAGAQFAFNFACWKPERVRAIVCVKSGPLREPPPAKIPTFSALFIVGEHDQPGRVREVARAFAAGRSLGAPWCLAFQPGAGHGSEGCRELAAEFIRAVAGNGSAEGSSYAELAAPDSRLSDSASVAKDANWSWLPRTAFAQVWRRFVKAVALSRLLTLPDQKRPNPLSWRPITPLPERIDGSRGKAKFEYAISLPQDRDAIVETKVKTSSPVLTAAAVRRSDREWNIAGECDVRQLSLGAFKARIQVELVTAGGATERGEIPLFTRITGPVSISPPSLYYGVLPRDTTAVFDFVIRADPPGSIRHCAAISSAPDFAAAVCSRSSNPGESVAKCTIRSGARIGEKSGRLTIRVETDRPYLITVPFYGFIKK